MEQRISIITLGVTDLQRSKRFYESLGWDVASKEESESIVAFNLQSFVMALYPIKSLAKELINDTLVKDDLKPTSCFTLAYNVSSKEVVRQVIEEARSIGAKIEKEPTEVFWGGYSGYFSDPDGYLWEVSYNPFSKLDSSGNFQWGKDN